MIAFVRGAGSLAALGFISLFVVGCALVSRAQAQPIKVYATLPDLGSLALAVGGDEITLTVAAKGPEDAHFVEAKPSLIKALSEADLYVQAGLELEIGYAPLLLQGARNAKVLPGNPGFIDASTVIAPLEVPPAPIDRSQGDVHPFGNPHYLLDPLNGLRVAALIRDRLSALQPGRRDQFARRYDDFRQRLAAALAGERLAGEYDAEQLAVLHEHGKLMDFLSQQGDSAALAGWLGAMAPYYGTKFVDEHNLWPYLARRFGLVVAAHLEPKPGIPPALKHLENVIALVQSEHIKLVVTAPYYDPKHASLVARASGAQVVHLAHQTGSVAAAADYLSMVDYNVRTLAAALAAGR